ncbi:hypothetical protein G7062_00315 [Erysipelothrix sp. HDW6C]|uniref:hypothetical protein n=1 Tax=Erysipelothrix sp. HDW6C TaxID=2714930 RepID=UPI00140B9A0E|nr:hypothetical protein [Erysipelothrix sp. HDW6C]QIK68818.1 hypothetical protein G7062_00315 [Erysipelothrix sp. HDW6C]
MNALYSWLQDAVNVADLNDYLYWFELADIRNGGENLDRIYATLNDAIDLHAFAQAHQITIEVKTSPNVDLHAQYDPNNHIIWINTVWLEKYQPFIGDTDALNLHLAHEIYHVIEENGTWYDGLKYKIRHAISEVSALYFSQKQTNLPFHPKLVEYAIGLEEEKYSKDDLVSYLRERTKDYEIYRNTKK